MPKFSIIIPVYNVAPYLHECLDSVLAQTFTDWEAICVDDGSTDGSGVILDEYAVKDKRFRVIHQTNAGVSVARNIAFDIAKGQYVGFLDGDDVWPEDWLAVVAEEICQHENVDWIRLGLIRWDGGARPHIKKAGSSVFYDGDVLLLLWNKVCRLGYGCINFYRRECVGANRFKVGLKVSEDTLFALEVANQLKTVVIIPYDGYLYRQREGSALAGGAMSNAKDNLAFVSEFVSLVEAMNCQMRAFVCGCSEAVGYRIMLHSGRWWSMIHDMTSEDCRVWRSLLWRLYRCGINVFWGCGWRRKLLRLVVFAVANARVLSVARKIRG